MRAKELKVSIQKVIRIILAIISLIALIISAWIIIDCFKKPPAYKKPLFNYTVNSTLDYKVYLKNNRFYENRYMGKDKKYLASIIDYIDIDLNYNFFTSVLSNSSYSYNIKAVVSSSYEVNGSEAELWSKSYEIVPLKTNTVSSTSGFQIKENIKLDYDQYNAVAKEFKEEYSVSSETFLNLVITIRDNTTVKDYDSPLSENKTITLKMPLNKTVTDIELKGTDPVNKTITETIQNKKNIPVVLLVIAIIVAIVALPVVIISFYKLFAITNISQYITEQNKILKGFGDIIAEVTAKPDLEGLKVIEVKKFEDLINIEEELRVPILFYESQAENVSWFLITTDTQVYRYILESEETKQNNTYYARKNRENKENNKENKVINNVEKTCIKKDITKEQPKKANNNIEKINNDKANTIEDEYNKPKVSESTYDDISKIIYNNLKNKKK